MDDVDHAQARAAQYTAEALREHWRRQQIGTGCSHCKECGDEIPEARRRAHPAATHCLNCQTEIENARRIP